LFISNFFLKIAQGSNVSFSAVAFAGDFIDTVFDALQLCCRRLWYRCRLSVCRRLCTIVAKR